MNRRLQPIFAGALRKAGAAALLALAAASAHAISEGHGPDSWLVTDATSPADEIRSTAPEAAQHEASADAMIAAAEALVTDLYASEARAEQGLSTLQGQAAARYFTADIVNQLQAGGFGAHPLYGAQDFDGHITHIGRDSDQPMFRGMITVNVDFTNFGEPQRAVYLLRADTIQEDAPLRIFRVEHEGWSYP